MKLGLSRLFEFNIEIGLYDMFRPTIEAKKIKAYEKKPWVIVRGRSLFQIAYDLYGDAGWWIFLAYFNDLVDPFNLPSELYFVPRGDLYNALNGG